MSEKTFEVELLTKDLIHALNFTSSIIEKRHIKPVLGNVKLESGYNNLIITGTSADLSIKISLSSMVKVAGATTVGVTTFSEIVRKLNDEKIIVSCEKGKDQLSISANSFSSELSTISAEEFPALDNKLKTKGSFNVPAKKFLRLLLNTEFAMSTEETRYNLNGIYLNYQGDGKLNATAIDGHRLSTVSENISNLEEFGVILPKKTVYELIKLLKDSQYAELDLNVEYDSHKIFFKIGKVEVISKLIDATFPDYKSLIPKNYKNKLSIQCKKLAEAVDRVSTITHDKFRAVKVFISKEKVEISAFGETKGTANEKIVNNEEEYFNYEGDDIEVGFNPRYILEILKNLDNEDIDVMLNASLDPIVIKPQSNDEDRYIIMPMKV